MPALRPVIVCVDDEKIILDSLQEQILRRLGDRFDCEVAESPEEGLELIEDLIQEKREIAVVISDHIMPRMYGDQFLIEVHQKLPSTLKILLTGQASMDAVRNAINHARLHRYVMKPWQEEDLMLAVEEAALSYLSYLERLEYSSVISQLTSATQKISGKITRSEINRVALEEALRTLQAEEGLILIQQEENLIVEIHGKNSAQGKFELLYEGLSDPLYLQDTIQDILEKYMDDSLPDYVLLAPIRLGNLTQGYLFVQNPKTKLAFSPVKSNAAKILADQIAISWKSASAIEEINRQKRDLEEAQQDIQESLEYARRIQLSLMPSEDTFRLKFPGSFYIYKPLQALGGDFIWVYDEGSRFYIASIDCTGHGVPGALVSIVVNVALNTLVREYHITAPDILLSMLDMRVRESLHHHEHRDGAEIGLLILDKNEQKAIYTGTKRNPLLYFSDGEFQKIKTTTPGIGDILPTKEAPPIELSFLPASSFPIYEIPLRKNMWFFLYSDGFQDILGGPENRRLGASKVDEVLKKSCDASPLSPKEFVLRFLEDYLSYPDAQQLDDILVIGLRYDP
ncbi:MAG: SpoIIE family protein phosphatase [Bacteroidia bacterium]